jgi:predicted nucleotidyltransferase
MNIIRSFIDKKMINPPAWVKDNLCYSTITGSQSYGYATDKSDIDIASFAINPRIELFPHEQGKYIYGFGKKLEPFETYATDKKLQYKDKEYDVVIHGIVKYFNLLVDNNPTQLETLYTPFNCVVYTNDVGKLVRENRSLFLSTRLYHRYIGYAFSQLNALKKDRIGNRLELIEKYGYDVKSASHVVRLCLFGEQFLKEGDLEITRHAERLKAIRRGDVAEQEIRDWFTEQEKYLKKVYEESKLPYSPNMDKIRDLLLRCLEIHYGSLEKAVINLDKESQTLRKLSEIIKEAGY